MGTAFTAAGFAVGIAIYVYFTRRDGLATEGMRWVLLTGLCGGVLGAKLTEWTFDGALFAHPDRLLSASAGGRTIIGGVLCGWLTVELVKRRLGLRRATGDYFALALAGGEAVGRIGCFFNGCCYGLPTSLPWAVWQHDAWRHPSQLYMAAAALGLFLLLLWRRRHPLPSGHLFLVYLTGFGASRFVLEFFRERPILFGGLSLAQGICLEMAVVGVILIYRTGMHRPAS